jgi:hypothetical protein
MAQGHERPGGSAVGFSLRSAARFSEDAIAFGDSIGRRRATAMARHDGGQPVLIEAGDELRNGIARAAASGVGSGSVGVSSSNSEKSFGTSNMAGGFGL